MKKSKMKSLITAARKVAKEGIEEKLVTELTEVAGKLGKGNKKLVREIKKGSKKLAKKVAKELKIDKTIILASKESEPKKVAVKKTEVLAPLEVEIVEMADLEESPIEAKSIKVKDKIGKKAAK